MGSFQQALNNKLGRVKQGITNLLPANRSVVDNDKDPGSALNMQRRNAVQRKIGTAAPQYTIGKPKLGQVLGTPPGGSSQLSKR